MSLARHIAVIGLILFTFIGNIGLRVFTHSCEEDGVFRSYFVQLQDHCEDKQEELPPCCQKEQRSCGESITKDCCDDQVDVYRISLDYFSDYEVSITDLAESNVYPLSPVHEVIRLTEPQIVSSKADPPPKPSGREILNLNCIYRI